MGFTTPEDEQVIVVSEIVWIHGVGIGERVVSVRNRACHVLVHGDVLVLDNGGPALRADIGLLPSTHHEVGGAAPARNNGSQIQW